MHQVKITAQKLSFGYPQNQILHNVSFDIDADHNVGIHAPNGEGKTTLLYLLAHMIKPDKGSVIATLDGKQLSIETYRRYTGVSFSDRFIMKDFTINENLKLFTQFYPGIDTNYTAELMEMFGLNHISQRRCRFLSQGELKKVSIIRALMHQPKFIFLDEPTTGLDQRSMDVLKDHLRTLDSLLLVTSHDRSWMCDVSSKIWTIEDRGVHVL